MLKTLCSYIEFQTYLVRKENNSTNLKKWNKIPIPSRKRNN